MYEARQSDFSGVGAVATSQEDLTVLNNGGAHPALRLTLARDAQISGRIVSLTGAQVAEVPRQMLGAGEHLLPLDAGSLTSGVYLVRLDTPGGPRFCRVVIAR